MRFSTAAFGALATLAVFMPSVSACEHVCQVNVSRAFSDKYEIVSNNYFTLLTNKVKDSVFYGLPKDTLTADETTASIKVITDAVAEAGKAWSATLFQTVFTSIFADEPKFKGDCNNPHRVTQPPKGVWWKMADCHNMDYICGNPPSICHFMPMIKTRIVKKLIGQLQAKVDGDESDVYEGYIEPALQTVLTQQPKLVEFTPILHGNLNQILESIKLSLVNFADEAQWNKDWDLQIKEMLLTFP
ncbi:hypothetical protein EMPS_09430 [Entomortierella parvispora]|uniref:Uncharacterized protein n=1 Tax=Entomortierella parvispora TaxID=205924 RepID=A0A9P3HI71_9FUNG|nr:hypothetical protein EMPS_09430 [Entomortierella parvispora]